MPYLRKPTRKLSDCPFKTHKHADVQQYFNQKNMLSKKRYMILMLVFSLLSYTNTNRLSDNEIFTEENIISVFPKNEDMNHFDLSPYLDSIKFVKLEFTDESIIGKITKSVIYEDRIYILDDQTNSLFIFDMEGKYIHKISDVGQGPGEYIQLDFFDIDRENKQIVLTDLMAYWIMRYDMEGNFLYRKEIPVWCEGVSVLPNNGIVLYANFRNNSEKLSQEYNLIFLDSLMNIKKTYFPYNSKDFDLSRSPSSSLRGQFYAFENNLYFSFPWGNRVYLLSGDSIVNKYQFNFGDDILPIENPVNPELFTIRLTKGRYNGLMTPLMENERVLFFSMRTNLNLPYLFSYSVIYSKESGNQISSFSLAFEDAFFSSSFLTGYGPWIVSEIQSDFLVNWKESYIKNLKNKTTPIGRFTKELLAFTDELTEEDNPVLMFYKLNPF